MLIHCLSLPAAPWHPPQQPLPQPGAGQLLLGRVHVPSSAALAAQAPYLLAPAEQARAARYYQAADRQRFQVARGALRHWLGQCLGLAPAAVPLGTGPNQKPVLLGSSGLHFSVSHTREWVLLALATTEIGVDVEDANPDFAFAEVLDASFSLAEQAALAASPAPTTLFYQLWTRKEALVKATGQGIDEQLPALPALDGQHRVAGPRHAAWQVGSFAVAPGYPAALAYPAGNWQLSFLDLTAMGSGHTG